MLYWLLNVFYRSAGAVIAGAGHLAGGCALLLVLVTAVDVFLRYFMDAGSVAVQELEWHLFSAIFLLGAAYTLQQDKHVRVDIFYSRLPTRGKALIDLFGSLVFLFPLCWLGIQVGIPFVERSFALGEVSSDPGGLPMRYIPKSLIVLAFMLLTLEGIGGFLRDLTRLLHGSRAEHMRRR